MTTAAIKTPAKTGWGDWFREHFIEKIGILDFLNNAATGRLCHLFCLSFRLFRRFALVFLILTAGFGDGHNTAARNVAEALRRLHPREEVLVHDLVATTHPCLFLMLQRLYQISITNWPRAWKLTYRWLATHAANGTREEPWQLPMLTALTALIRKTKPRAIVSTYPLYPGLLATIRQDVAVPPLMSVVTDSITVHPIWVAAPSDLYAVADDETQGVMQGLGVPNQRIRVTGFPVSLAFVDMAERPDDPVPGRVLYLPATSKKWVADTLESLRPLVRSGVHLTLPVGKHGPRLYHTIRRFADSLPENSIEVIGWTDRIPELLCAHDAVITKAGGAILHEVLAARCPPIIDHVVPGQEEGNAEYLLSRGCALRTHSPAETGQAVARLLADDCCLAHEISDKMRPISIPDGAMRAAKALGEL